MKTTLSLPTHFRVHRILGLRFSFTIGINVMRRVACGLADFLCQGQPSTFFRARSLLLIILLPKVSPHLGQRPRLSLNVCASKTLLYVSFVTLEKAHILGDHVFTTPGYPDWPLYR